MRTSLSDLTAVALVVLFTSACVTSAGDDGDVDPDPTDGIDTPFRCGNGVADAAEECDESDLKGTSCEGLGFGGGTLGCDLQTCRFDTDQCVGTQILQNHNNACNRELGCSNADGTSGNPQSTVECFNSTVVAPPFSITEVSYTIGASRPAPNSLDVEVYEWTGSGPPGTLLSKTPLAAGDLTTGPHTVSLATPVVVATSGVCLGVAGSDPNDGYRILFSDTAPLTGTAWTSTTTCGNGAFQDVIGLLNDPAVTTGSWCISASVSKVRQP